jgi:hypothetical protein
MHLGVREDAPGLLDRMLLDVTSSKTQVLQVANWALVVDIVQQAGMHSDLPWQSFWLLLHGGLPS